MSTEDKPVEKLGLFSRAVSMLKKAFTPEYRFSAAAAAEANAAIQLAMLQAVIDLQVKTVYGLKYEGVAFVFQQQATTLSEKAKSDDISRADRATYLHMSKGMLDMANHLKFQGVKNAGRV